MKVASNNMSKIAVSFQFEADAVDRRMEVFEEVSQIKDFIDEEKLEGGEFITSASSKTDYFITLPASCKKLYLQWLLAVKT